MSFSRSKRRNPVLRAVLIGTVLLPVGLLVFLSWQLSERDPPFIDGIDKLVLTMLFAAFFAASLLAIFGPGLPRWLRIMIEIIYILFLAFAVLSLCQ